MTTEGPPYPIYTWPVTPFAPEPQTISGITRAMPPVVTTTANHGYTTGQVVRIICPKNFGMPQINSQVFIISVLAPTTFALYLSFVNRQAADTRNYDAFIAATGLQRQVAQVVPMGEGPTQSFDGYFRTTLDSQVYNTLEV
jgi:hypothetical protein